jgi:hypothetical protein
VLKRRHVYVLLFAAPALLVSILAAALMLAVSAGALWLFLLGDNPWPPAASTLLGAVFFVVGAGMWLALLWTAWAVGRQQEDRPALNAAHVMLAIGVTVVLAALIGGRLTGLSLNPFGARSDSVTCADLCRAKGFVGSSTPPRSSGDRTCRCYDAAGREAESIDLSAAGR